MLLLVAALLLQQTPLATVGVVASSNDGNVPINTLDDDLGTRWSAYGDGQWIRYDLGMTTSVNRLDVSWYLGNIRSAHFDIQVSLDTLNWVKVFSGQASGQTLLYEHYPFTTTTARYIRIVGHGQWNGTTLASWWVSVTELRPYGSWVPPTPAIKVAPTLTIVPAAIGTCIGCTAAMTSVGTDSLGQVVFPKVTWRFNPAIDSVHNSTVYVINAGTDTLQALANTGATATVVVNAPALTQILSFRGVSFPGVGTVRTIPPVATLYVGKQYTLTFTDSLGTTVGHGYLLVGP